MKLAIKIDVDSLRGATIGVPRLAELLSSLGAGATFLFSVGPDRSGRRIARVLHPGMPSRLWRTRSVRDYDIRSGLYGVAYPGPDIGLRCADIMRGVRDQGFETGVRGFDQTTWQHRIDRRKPEWVGDQMSQAIVRYQHIFGEPPRVHGAAGWQMNRHAYRLTQRLEYACSSDTRGTEPFIPVYQAELISCPQLPTTLPTLDEMVCRHDIDQGNLVDRMLDLTSEPRSSGHVFTANARFDGLKLLPQFEKLLLEWRAQGYEFVSLSDYMASVNVRALPFHEVVTGTIPGRPGTVALQGKAFLA